MRLPIGIEISDLYFKLVAGRSQGTLSNWIVEPVTSLSDEQISNKISDTLRKWKLKPKSLTLSLSRNLVTVRNLHLPSQDKQEITQMIDLNVARIVPYKKEEIVFGYQILGIDEMSYTKVILAIIQNNIIRRHLKIIEKAGLVVDRISLSSYGIWEWVLNKHRQDINQTDLYLLLDINSVFTDFIIFTYNNLFFSRSINVGADSIRDSGQIGITKLLGEVKQSLIMFYNEEINKKPLAAFLSGADIKKDLTDVVKTELGIPVKIVVSPCPKESAVSLTGVAELTISDNDRRIYFALPEIQIRKSLKERTKELIILGSFLVYFFTIVCVMFLGKIQIRQSYLSKLNQHYNDAEKELKEPLEKLSKIEFVKTYLAKRRLPLIIVTQLQKITPEEVVINTLTIDEHGKVTLRGEALQLSDVFKFTNTLEKIEYFKDIQTKSTRKKKVKDRDLTEFELSFTFVS